LDREASMTYASDCSRGTLLLSSTHLIHFCTECGCQPSAGRRGRLARGKQLAREAIPGFLQVESL